MKSARRRRGQEGQALVYVTLILAILVTILYALYDIGRLVMAKIQAQNGADAAALAAVSLKVSAHHTRELAYLAMTDRALHARVEMLYALAELGSPGGELVRRLNRAQGYIKQLTQLRTDLMAYNDWLDANGDAMVQDAARLGYVANIQGINEHMTSAMPFEMANWRQVDADGAVREVSGAYKFIGGVNYEHEGLGHKNVAGKTFIEVVPKYMGINWAFFGKKAGAVDVPAWASAGFANSDVIGSRDPGQGSAMTLGVFKLHWLSPRLVRTGQMHNGSFGGPNAGSGIVSQH